jgi:hypothetical protein
MTEWFAGTALNRSKRPGAMPGFLHWPTGLVSPSASEEQIRSGGHVLKGFAYTGHALFETWTQVALAFAAFGQMFHRHLQPAKLDKQVVVTVNRFEVTDGIHETPSFEAGTGVMQSACQTV